MLVALAYIPAQMLLIRQNTFDIQPISGQDMEWYLGAIVGLKPETEEYEDWVSFDSSADAFHGRVIGIQDVIDFYGRTPDELRQEFKNSVEEYLAWCTEEGTPPEKTWLGKLTLRLDDDLRRRLAVVAAAHDESINRWVTNLLDRETKRLLEEQAQADET